MEIKNAVDIKKLKNGNVKVLFTTPNGRTSTIAKYDNEVEALQHVKRVEEQIINYYK